MKHARMSRTTLAAVSAGIGLAAATVQVLPADAASMQARIAPRYVILNCRQKAEVKPVDFTSACADNGFGVTNKRPGKGSPD